MGQTTRSEWESDMRAHRELLRNVIEEHREGRNEVEVCAQGMRELHVADNKNAWDKSLHVWECRNQSEKESPR